MVLVDSNVFIDFWNSATDELIDIFKHEDIVICGVIRAELLHGAVSENNFDKISSLLDSFDEMSFDVDDWQELGKNLYMLRRSGLTIPLSDAMIATVAIKYNIPLWTSDKHFVLIQNVLSTLKLYKID